MTVLKTAGVALCAQKFWWISKRREVDGNIWKDKLQNKLHLRTCLGKCGRLPLNTAWKIDHAQYCFHDDPDKYKN